MPNLFELARVRVIACSSYRDSTVLRNNNGEFCLFALFAFRSVGNEHETSSSRQTILYCEMQQVHISYPFSNLKCCPDFLCNSYIDLPKLLHW